MHIPPYTVNACMYFAVSDFKCYMPNCNHTVLDIPPGTHVTYSEAVLYDVETAAAVKLA